AAASVGVNGNSDVVGESDVEGSWIAYGGMSGTGEVVVRDDLLSTRDVTGVGSARVGHDLAVGGNLVDVGDLSVGGTLRVAGADDGVGEREVTSRGPYAAPASSPCACEGAGLLDVAAEVASARASNDNAARGIPTDAASVVGERTLSLTTGRYYLS